MEICNRRLTEAEEMGKRINSKLEQLYTKEDARIQEVLKLIKDRDNKSLNEVKELITKGKLTLVIGQRYSVASPQKGCSLGDYGLVVTKDIHMEFINLEERKPEKFSAVLSERSGISLSFLFFNEDEINFLKPYSLLLKIVMRMQLKNGNEKEEEEVKTFIKEYILGSDKSVWFNEAFPPKYRLLLGRENRV